MFFSEYALESGYINNSVSIAMCAIETESRCPMLHIAIIRTQQYVIEKEKHFVLDSTLSRIHSALSKQ